MRTTRRGGKNSPPSWLTYKPGEEEKYNRAVSASAKAFAENYAMPNTNPLPRTAEDKENLRIQLELVDADFNEKQRVKEKLKKMEKKQDWNPFAKSKRRRRGFFSTVKHRVRKAVGWSASSRKY
jgi:hypothetical protein